jgi:hypothetical protein
MWHSGSDGPPTRDHLPMNLASEEDGRPESNAPVLRHFDAEMGGQRSSWDYSLTVLNNTEWVPYLLRGGFLPYLFRGSLAAYVHPPRDLIGSGTQACPSRDNDAES